LKLGTVIKSIFNLQEDFLSKNHFPLWITWWRN